MFWWRVLYFIIWNLEYDVKFGLIDMEWRCVLLIGIIIFGEGLDNFFLILEDV